MKTRGIGRRDRRARTGVADRVGSGEENTVINMYREKENGAPVPAMIFVYSAWTAGGRMNITNVPEEVVNGNIIITLGTKSTRLRRKTNVVTVVSDGRRTH